MLALIDGDAIAYRCAASAEHDSDQIAIWRVDKLMRDILDETGCGTYRLFLGGPNNFRKRLFPLYKGNRVQAAPQFLQATRDYLVDEWKAEVTDGYEADDALGMSQTKDTIICAYDKDLLQIPGRHYNFVKKEFLNISEEEGWYNFYHQLLTGDRSDNIPGLKGIGKAKADKILASTDPDDYFDVVREKYNNDPMMLLNGQLIYIMRAEDDFWNPVELLESLDVSVGDGLLERCIELYEKELPEVFNPYLEEDENV